VKPEGVEPYKIFGCKLKKPIFIIYDREKPDRTWIETNDDQRLEDTGPTPHPKREKGFYYVYTYRDAIKFDWGAPPLIMRDGSSHFANRIEISGDSEIVYTFDNPFLGSRNEDNGVRLWIKTKTRPTADWYTYAYFLNCRKQTLEARKGQRARAYRPRP
jgi:hypothetical protein